MEADQSRKSFLKYLIGGLVGFGAGAVSIPLIGSLAVTRDRRGGSKLLVDISKISLGGSKEVMLHSLEPPILVPITIIRRTPDMIKLARANDGGKDPQPDSERVSRPEWLIVSPICTHLGCHVTWEPEGADKIKDMIRVLEDQSLLDAADKVDDEPRKDPTKLDQEIEAARAPLVVNTRALQGLAGLPLPCHCHGSFFDYSGRIIKGPAKTNLRIPIVKFISDNRVQLSWPIK